jgi:hypothetical protein
MDPSLYTVVTINLCQMLNALSVKDKERGHVGTYLGTIKPYVSGQNKKDRLAVRALLDSGAQLNLLLESALPGLEYRIEKASKPYLIQGVTPGQGIWAMHYADVYLVSKDGDHLYSVRFVVIPLTEWRISVPHPPAPWVVKIRHLLADPELLDPPTPILRKFHMILGSAECVRFVGEVAYRHNRFQMKHTPFGILMEGDNPGPSEELPSGGYHPFHKELHPGGFQERPGSYSR